MSDLLLPFEPSAQDPFDLKKAGHLLRRAAFGGSLFERRRLVDEGVIAAVRSVLEPGPGEDVDAALDDVIALGEIERVRTYRFWRLLRGRERLKERMSFFWHCHFATSDAKVNDPAAMARQQALFDRLGLSTFDELLLAVSQDPAMLRWLDNESNVKGKANENFARELLELFALGRGSYGEKDVQEAARAFTGWHLRDGRFRFVKAYHDDGTKQVLGRSGRLTGEDVVALLVRDPASARFVARKLLAFFVHPEPVEAEVSALAACYEANGRHLGKTCAVLLGSRLFFSARAYRSRIKSPVDLCVGLVRSLSGNVAPKLLARASALLGQTLCEPPSVEGWAEERAWVTSATWLLRANFASDLFAGRHGWKLAPSADALLAHAASPSARADAAITLLLDDDVAPAVREHVRAFARSKACEGPGGAGMLLHAVQSLPEAQLL